MLRKGWGETMADLTKSSNAAVRATDALLRAAGGRAVLLRLPAPGVPADAAEQLGLAVPEFQDVELKPVVVRAVKAGSGKASAGTRELLVSATAVNSVVGSLAFAAASVLFAVAYGVLLDGVLLEVISATEQETGGVPYLYRLIVRVPAAFVV